MTQILRVLCDYTNYPCGLVSEVWLKKSKKSRKIEHWALRGECKKCGQCCEKLVHCDKLKEETVDDVKYRVCSIYWDRPIRCAMWPVDPYGTMHPMLPGCGYKWEKLK